MKKIVISAFLISILSIFYFPAKAQENDSSTDSSQLQEENEVRQKVEQKVEEALNKPKARLGTITDISEMTIQMKTLEGEIQQVSFNPEETSFVSVNNESRSINASEVAIGDFIIAMGYLNTNNVLESERILVTSAIDTPERVVFLGEVKNLENNVLTVTDSTGELSFSFPKKWVGPEKSNITPGIKVAVVAITNEGEFPAIRTLDIVSEPNLTDSSEE